MLVLAGFSFFYTFMRKYAYSAISHTFLITVLAAQWYARPPAPPHRPAASPSWVGSDPSSSQDHPAPDLLAECG